MSVTRVLGCVRKPHGRKNPQRCDVEGRTTDTENSVKSATRSCGWNFITTTTHLIHPTVPIGNPRERVRAKGLERRPNQSPKAKPFPRDQAASGGDRPTQTAGSSAEAGSTAEAAPGQDPEPEESEHLLRDPFFYTTPEEQAEFTKAEERFWGVDRLAEESEHSESGHS